MIQTIRGLSIKNFFTNILFFLSGCAVILLNVYNRQTAALGVLLALVLLFISCSFQNIHAFVAKNVNRKVVFLACIIAALSAAVCYNALLACTDISGKSILFIYAAGCGIVSVYFLCVVLCLLHFPPDAQAPVRPDGRHLTRADFLAIGVIITAILGIGVWYLSRKCSYFADEIYTFGLANSYYQPFLYNPLDGIGILSTAERYRDYLQVTSNPFSYGSVLYNQICDVHPPLYYLLIHTVCSIAPQMPLMTGGVYCQRSVCGDFDRGHVCMVLS